MPAAKGTMVIAGYGPGVGHAMAMIIGKDRGYAIALLSRTQAKVDAAANELIALGVQAAGFAVDLSDPNAVIHTIQKVRNQLGEVSLLFWNSGGIPKALFDLTTDDIHDNLKMNVDSLLFATKTVQKDLEKHNGAILITGGGLGLDNEPVTQLAIDWGAATFALNAACKHKLAHILHLSLKPLGVFVGEVMVCGVIRNTPGFDPEGKSPLTDEAVAEAFAALLDKREQHVAMVG